MPQIQQLHKRAKKTSQRCSILQGKSSKLQNLTEAGLDINKEIFFLTTQPNTALELSLVMPWSGQTDGYKEQAARISADYNLSY
jgi:hypothetical protein